MALAEMLTIQYIRQEKQKGRPKTVKLLEQDSSPRKVDLHKVIELMRFLP